MCTQIAIDLALESQNWGLAWV